MWSGRILSLRMHLRRFTRLTNAFSKRLVNLKAAVTLYVAFYNFCRVHTTLRVTPAMQAGLADHVWTIAGAAASSVKGNDALQFDFCSVPTLPSIDNSA
jgi:hypothetical protein